MKKIKKFLEANNKSHFDFNKIMDDLLVGSLLNPKNGPPNNNTATFSYAPGVKIDKQAKNGPQKY